MAVLQTYLWIGIGSALGGISRYWVSEFMMQKLGDKFPVGTLLVNVSGSFFIGLLAALSAKNGWFHSHLELRRFLMIGVCGGYTTFSAFSLQTLDMIKGGQLFQSGLYVLVSVVLCISATAFGYFFGQITSR